MPTYKGKELTKVKDKSGGKNHDEVDGFYQNSDGEEFFIKRPKDRNELFTEGFAGALLEELKKRGLIDTIYHDSLICADFIQFEDGSYGLIQPRVYFTELHKIIGTSYWDGSDRSPLFEMFLGPRYYLLLTQTGQYFGLAVALMFSLLLGDYSVHSGNMVCLNVISVEEIVFTQFARIDWGAAFRYFGHADNVNLLHPHEYQGWLNIKSFTKGYFLNYKLISGLFLAIAEHAKVLIGQLNDDLLRDIVSTALRKIPVDLVDKKTQKELSQYLCMDSFDLINFSEQMYQPFLNEFIHLLNMRLKKMTELQDVYPINDNAQSLFSEHAPTPVKLQANGALNFPGQLKIWRDTLASSDQKTCFDFNSIDLPILTRQFNGLIDYLLEQFEEINPSIEGDNQTGHGIQELSSEQEKPSSILRHLFTLKPDATPLYSCQNSDKDFNESSKVHLKHLASVLTLGFDIVVTVRVIRETQNLKGHDMTKASAVRFLFNALQNYIDAFQESFSAFSKLIERKNTPVIKPEIEKISDKNSFFKTVVDNKFGLIPTINILS